MTVLIICTDADVADQQAIFLFLSLISVFSVEIYGFRAGLGRSGVGMLIRGE